MARMPHYPAGMARKQAPDITFRVGCSGWSHQHWRGNFYPHGVPQSRWLEHYAEHFDTVELNGSFYRLPAASTVEGWAGRVPAGFTFAVKVSRLITHFRRLRNCEAELRRFNERLAGLGQHLGPRLYQLPETVERDDQALEAFLTLLPKGGVHAFEFRNGSWWTDPVFDLLKRHNATFVIFNLGKTTTPLIVTAPDVYVRFHGPAAAYASQYTPKGLAHWAEQLDALEGVARVWAYFNNDVEGHAPRDATHFREIVTGDESR